MITGNASRAFLEPDASLASVLERAGARRLFVMGLATDYVVKNTVFDALHANDFLPPGYGARLPANLSQVVLVDAATRAVVPTLGEVVKADVVAKGGAVVYAAGARDAMVELCAGTCDGQADCGAGEYCSPNADAETFPWGACAACPGAAAPCGGRGNCTEAGSCACDAGWRGDACESPSCPAGTYVDGEACAPCPAGTASSIENAPVCPICGLVEYQPSTGATACEAYGRSSGKLASVRATASYMLLLLSFVVLPSCSLMIFTYFGCVSYDLGDYDYVDGVFVEVEDPLSVLAADATIECYGPRYNSWGWYVGLMIAVYPVGECFFVVGVVYLFRRRAPLLLCGPLSSAAVVEPAGRGPRRSARGR